MKIFRWISAAVSEAIYPLIPQLYKIFNILAKYTFFEDGQVEKLSNNLYILISVCMLFAFGIRLLNGIVNPEIVGDKKKGTRTVFLNAFFAVMLMALIPFGFDALREVQSHVIDSALIEKFMLGTSLSDKQDPGQILAAYTFSSTCYPEKTVGDDKIEELYAGTLEDIDDIKYLSKKVTKTHKDSNGEDEYDLHYETILSPLAGGVVVYEMILICMDVALRTVKLGLLELITPIILCGFIFKGSELLQKWTKEVISTYILLFLKVAMIVFMIYGMALLPGFMDRIDFPKGTGDFTKGLIKLFILIGLLQVVKQLPNIINALFGTNIQPRGGIKGRLGEMAAVGKMAQDAWSWTGNKAKGLGGAAVGLGLGAAGGLARNGWQAIKTGYNEHYKNKNLQEKLSTAKDRASKFGKNVVGGAKKAASTVAHPIDSAQKAGSWIKENGVGTLKKGALTGLTGLARGLGNAAELAKAGYGAGGFAAGVKAGKEASSIKVPKAISDDNLGTSQTHATRRAAGLNEDTGTITKETRSNFTNYAKDKKEAEKKIAAIQNNSSMNDSQKASEIKKIKDNFAKTYSEEHTAGAYAKKAVDAHSNVLSSDQQRVTLDHIESKGKLTELKKADDAKNAMAGILSQMGSNLSLSIDSNDKALGQTFTNWSQAISDKAGEFDLSSVMSQVSDKLSGNQNLQTQFAESLKALKNNQDMFNNCATSISMNFDGVKMGTSKDLNSQITSADIQANNLESVFKSVQDASSTEQKNAMNKAVTAGNTLFAMIPEYEQSDRGEIGLFSTIQTNPDGSFVRDNNGKIQYTTEWGALPASGPGNGGGQGGSGGSNGGGQQQNTPQSGTGGAQGGGPGQPTPHQQGDSSNPDHQNDGSYTPGMYNSPITANVDLGGLEGKLDQINNTISNSGQSVAQAVNNQGNNISKQLNTANERLKHMDAGITTANVKLGNLDKGIGNMSDNIGTLGRNLEDNNKDSDDEDE